MAGRGTLAFVDRLKGLGLLWIFLNHVAEQAFGGPHLGNPGAGWPSFGEQLGQLAPVTGRGGWDAPLNLLRWLGWTGDQGVALFILLSGFGLTWSLLQKDAPDRLPMGPFLRARVLRIFPPYWLAHLPFFATFLVVGWGMSPFAWESWASFFGLRLRPDLLYLFSPAWWYVTLALQLYLALPLLWWVLRRHGARALLLWGCGLPLAVRAVALFTTDAWLDFWSRGGFAITRLPELVLGMLLATWWYRDAAGVDAWLRTARVRVASAALYVAAFLASATLAGMVVAPALLLLGAFPWLYALVRGPDKAHDSLAWLGQRSYALYLVHHPVLMKFLPGALGPGALFARAAAGFVTTVLAGLALDRLSARVDRLGPRRMLLGLAGALALGAGGALGAELLIRRVAPQEVQGWGERPSLQPDERLGWKLVPSQETRLRWLTYDYVMRSNSLGFPAPDYPEARAPGRRRLMVFGDAFTSAEGVDWDQSWPRLLERALPDTEVLNFAVTGYGPDQYATLAEDFLPRFRPDALLATFFVNDFADMRMGYGRFREEIGFGVPLPEGLGSVLRLHHLKQYLALELNDRWRNWRGEERVYGYGLGHFDELVRQPASFDAEQVEALGRRFDRIRGAAVAAGATLVVLLIPSAPQVCDRAALDYFPAAVDPGDAKYDLERPQRLAREALDARARELIDLRPVLKSLPECPYFPRNMHWRPAGHAAVAGRVAQRFVE